MELQALYVPLGLCPHLHNHSMAPGNFPFLGTFLTDLVVVYAAMKDHVD